MEGIVGHESIKLDPYEKVPQKLRDIFKSWKGRSGRLDRARLQQVSDLAKDGSKHSDISTDILWEAFQTFQGPHGLYQGIPLTLAEIQKTGDSRVYSSAKVPGLYILPSLLPPSTQQTLLSRLLHRDLSNHSHTTNLHLHYDVQYPERQSLPDGNVSFFDNPPDRIAFLPKNPNENRPLASTDALKRKLRWMTLGGQYDWTRKAYPEEPPPLFPPDIASLIRRLFPDMEPQAAIVNIYSPGDTLSMHRDVSEEVDKGLVSISIGCDAIFVIGLSGEDLGQHDHYEVLRLRSGDAVYMTGKSRLAWHGVPSIIPGTCPEYLEEWPSKEYPIWKGWMKDKRINLNIRQMYQMD